MFLRLLIFAVFLPFAHASYAYDVPLSVSANAETMADAKATALRDGQRKAFYAALTKFAPTQSRDIYREFRDKDVTEFVSEYNITREVERAGYFEGDVTYKVDDAKITEIVKARQGIFASDDKDATPQGNGLLIIPAYDAGGQLLLWEAENLWRQALNNSAVEKGKGLLVMPFGDPRDIAILDDTAILTDNMDALKSSASRYGTRNVVIAMATLRNQDTVPVIEVTLRAAGNNKDKEASKQYTALAGETAGMMLSRVADETAANLSESLESFSLYGQKEEDKRKAIVVRFEYTDGAAWRKTENMFSRIGTIDRVDIGLVGVNRAEVTFIYKGDASSIESFFRSQGYDVDMSRDYWVVTAR
jgi:Uncharacterized protein conserved in bacteria (DUF2066)